MDEKQSFEILDQSNQHMALKSKDLLKDIHQSNEALYEAFHFYNARFVFFSGMKPSASS